LLRHLFGGYLVIRSLFQEDMELSDEPLTSSRSEDAAEGSKKSSVQKSEISDYYAVLGVSRGATEKQIGAAYKALALKLHPERNPDDDSAAEKYKAVTDAYNILSDTNKRRQYDLAGGFPVSSGTAGDGESVDVSALGGFGRVFGAVVSRFGFPIPTQLPGEVIESAKAICANGGIEGGGAPADPRVTDLVWGWGVDAKVDRQNAAYYRLTVEERHVNNGFVVICKSPSKVINCFTN
jgi:curved DNA-binding protein CbpA